MNRQRVWFDDAKKRWMGHRTVREVINFLVKFDQSYQVDIYTGESSDILVLDHGNNQVGDLGMDVVIEEQE